MILITDHSSDVCCHGPRCGTPGPTRSQVSTLLLVTTVEKCLFFIYNLKISISFYAEAFSDNLSGKTAFRSLHSQNTGIQQHRGMGRSCDCGGDPCTCKAVDRKRFDILPGE